jgi:hypothetical protein
MNKVSSDVNATGLDKVKGILTFKLNQYSDIEFTKDEITKLAEQFQYIELGSSTGLIMICKKAKCLYKNRCPLYMNDRAPEGKECLHENIVLKEAMANYVSSFEVDIHNYAEMVMVNQLVEYEVIEHRCNAILSLDHTDMKMESIIGVDDEGQIITKEEVSHALNIKFQVAKLKKGLFEDFTATRSQKWKKQAALKQAQDGPAKILSSMKKKLIEQREKQVIPEEVADKLNALGDDSY